MLLISDLHQTNFVSFPAIVESSMLARNASNYFVKLFHIRFVDLLTCEYSCLSSLLVKTSVAQRSKERWLQGCRLVRINISLRKRTICLQHVMVSECFHVLKTWLDMSRVKLYRNDLEGNKNYWFKLSRARVTKGKVTVNILRKSWGKHCHCKEERRATF